MLLLLTMLVMVAVTMVMVVVTVMAVDLREGQGLSPGHRDDRGKA